MRGNFEKIIQEKLYDAEVEAPELLDAIFERRSASHIFFNRLYLNRFRLLSGAAVLLVLLSIGWWKLKPETSTDPISSDPKQNQTTVEELYSPSPEAERSPDGFAEESAEQTNVPDARVDQYPIGTESPETQIAVNHGENLPVVSNQQATPVAEMPSVREKETTPWHINPEANTLPLDEPIVAPKTVPVVEQITEDVINPDSKSPENSNPAETTDSEKAVADAGPDSEPESSIPAESLIENETENGKNPIEVSKPNKWSVQFYAGPSYGYRTLEESGRVRDLRNESEKGNMGLSFGFQTAYLIIPGWEVLAGVQYHKRNEGLNYSYTRHYQEEVTRTREVKVYDPFGGSHYEQVEYTELESRSEDKSYAASNIYQHLSATLGIRRQFAVGPWKLGPSLAVGYRTWTNAQAVHLTEDMNLFSEDMVYGPNVAANPGAWQGRVGLQAGLALRNRWMLFVEPAATYFITPSSKGNGIGAPAQRDYFIDLNTGLRFSF